MHTRPTRNAVHRMLLAAGVAAVVIAAPARATDDAPSPGPRELAGHDFQVSHLVTDPFSVTSFGQNFGAGGGEALGPALDLSTNPPTVLPSSRWYGFGGFIEEVDLTVRVLEFLSVRAGFAAGLRQGAGNGSALVVGTAADVSGRIGVKGSLPLARSLRVSLSGDVEYGPQMNILILQGSSRRTSRAASRAPACSRTGTRRPPPRPPAPGRRSPGSASS